MNLSFKPFLNLFKSQLSSNKEILELEDKAKSVNKNSKGLDAETTKALAVNLFTQVQNAIITRNHTLAVPSYDFDVLKRAIEVEPYLRRCRDRYVEMIWKNGYDFVGDNVEAVNYIKRRFREIAYVTQKPTRVLFEEMSRDLVTYYNCIVIKIRDDSSSSGSARKFYAQNVAPVAGYFVADINYTMIKYDPFTRHIIGYTYINPYGYERDWDFRDVIHMYIDRPAAKFFGQPVMTTVLDDVRALRRMEENVEILVFQHTIPLYQYIVGTEEKPCRDGEVGQVKDEVEQMLTQGMLITPDRHKIVALGAQREALKVENYLEYFKTRILIGVGQSPASLGDIGGTTRSNANISIKSVIDAATRFQSTIKTYISDILIDELLREGGFDPFKLEDKVDIYIPEIDLDDKIRKEVHIMALYQGGLLDEDEARKELGRDPIINRKKMYFDLVIKPRTMIQAGMLGGDMGSNIKGQPQGLSKGMANKALPANQHGVKPKTKKQRAEDGSEYFIEDSIQAITLDQIKDEYMKEFRKNYYFCKDDIFSMIDDQWTSCDIALNLTKNLLAESCGKYIVSAYKKGVEDVGFNALVPIAADLSMLHTMHLSSVNNLFGELRSKLEDSTKTKEEAINIFESLEYRIEFICDWFVKKSYNIGLVSAAGANGKDYIEIECDNIDSEDGCHKNCGKKKIAHLNMEDVPPYHPHCSCEIKLES